MVLWGLWWFRKNDQAAIGPARRLRCCWGILIFKFVWLKYGSVYLSKQPVLWLSRADLAGAWGLTGLLWFERFSIVLLYRMFFICNLFITNEASHPIYSNLPITLSLISYIPIAAMTVYFFKSQLYHLNQFFVIITGCLQCFAAGWQRAGTEEWGCATGHCITFGWEPRDLREVLRVSIARW